MPMVKINSNETITLQCTIWEMLHRYILETWRGIKKKSYYAIFLDYIDLVKSFKGRETVHHRNTDLVKLETHA